MTFAGDCPLCGKSLGADPEVRARGRCDRCEITRLREAIKRIEDLIVRFWWAKDNTGAFEAMQSEALRIKAEREGR